MTGQQAPLSRTQERLWFLEKLSPGSAQHHLAVALQLSGRLDRAALTKSLGRLLDRHESLRTTISGPGGQAVATLLPEAPLALADSDLSTAPERMEAACAEEAARPFDLERGPLLRAALLRLGEAHHVLVLTVHQIACDAPSLDVLVRDLAALYEAFCAGPTPALPQLPSAPPSTAPPPAVTEHALAYWRAQLAGAPPLALVTDRPRAAEQRFKSGSVPISLSATDLSALGGSDGARLFPALLAAFYALLHRYGGDEDIVVGTLVDERTPAQAGLVGTFTNPLTLRGRVDPNLAFRHLVERADALVREASAHALPFEQLVQALKPERSLSRSPLYQAMLNVERTRAPVVFRSLDVDVLPLRRAGSQLDLSLTLSVGETGASGALAYNAELFDAATIARMVETFRALVHAAAHEPDRPLKWLAPLAPAENERILVEWNETRAKHPLDQCLHELLSAQAARTPDEVAVVFGGAPCTYRELDARANQLAHHLRKRGVGPETRVAICMERSLEMVIGLIGILKAGGAYVPLDPAYPARRLAHMVEDSRPKVLLTVARSSETVPTSDAALVCVDRDAQAIADEPTSAPASGTGPDGLAYVIFTSGSTGRPKGAMNTHRGIVNRLSWMQKAFRLTAEDRVLQKTPFSFDVSVWEFFWPLLVGARLVVAQPGGHQDPSYLVDVIRAQGITTLHFVPSMLAVFLESKGVESCTSVRQVMASGEALLAAHERRFFERMPAAELHNLYGPTEASVDVTVWTCRHETAGPTVPIGRPIDNTQIYILDRHLQPVPIGAPGELHIGGVGVGRGYFGRPDLTAARFVPDPFGAPGQRLYKTGDLARHRPDGNIEYLGRIDDQVKIRGFRIELEEISAVLRQSPGLRDALVVARPDGSGDPRLVAYVVATSEPAPAPLELKRRLAESLPEHMVPSAFVVLPALPLSPNGKVDRRALPQPAELGAAPDSATPARDVLELELVHLWEDLFGIRPIGVNDDFFALGGHSLLAMRLMARVEQRYGQMLPLSTIFRGPTIERLAVLLREGTSAPWSPLVPLRAGKKRPLFLVHPIGGNVLCYVELARTLGSDQPVYGLQARGLDGKQKPFATIPEQAAFYIDAIRNVQPKGPYLIGGWSSGGVVAFEMAQQLRQKGETTALLAVIDTRAIDREHRESSFIMVRGYDRALMAFWFSITVGRTVGLEVEEELRDFEALDDDGRIERIMKVMRRVDALPAGVGAERVRLLFDLYINNLRALITYVTEPYPDRVTLFKASDPVVELPDRPTPPDWAWGPFAPQLEEHWIPGTHFMVLHRSNVKTLAQKLGECLERAHREIESAPPR